MAKYLNHMTMCSLFMCTFYAYNKFTNKEILYTLSGRLGMLDGRSTVLKFMCKTNHIYDFSCTCIYIKVPTLLQPIKNMTSL